VAAHGGHLGLYVLILVVSGTGWVVATTFRTPMTGDLLGIQILPLVTSVQRGVRDLFEESHKVSAYVLAALVVLHVAGALRHHLFKKNDVLRRMI